ncbi:MAG: SWIM zinc finger family protein [Chloroflexota bacterium]
MEPKSKIGQLLNSLTEADIRARCTEASYEKGRAYYQRGVVRQRRQLDHGLESRVLGAQTYRVIIREAAGELAAVCTCPYDWGGDCKHIVATLLAWLHEPGSFRDESDLQSALSIRSQEELVAILADICAVYPHLIDEFGLLGEVADYNPAAVVAAIFEALHPPGAISEDEGVARMETVARHAAWLVRQGQGSLARRTYYVLTTSCKEFCETYGSYEIFPENIPYDFAVAYQALALQQLEDETGAIQAEVQEMLHGDWAPEILGLEEALKEVWVALGL